MAIVLLHRLALQEFRKARRWYARRSFQAAERFRDAVKLAIRKIEERPTLAPSDESNIRWIRTGRYPYVLYYEYFSNDVALILAVAHERRRLGYWRGRRSQA